MKQRHCYLKKKKKSYGPILASFSLTLLNEATSDFIIDNHSIVCKPSSEEKRGSLDAKTVAQQCAFTQQPIAPLFTLNMSNPHVLVNWSMRTCQSGKSD